MAFTDAQKRDIRKYLGVAFGFYDLDSRLESMMDMVGGNATDSSEIAGWLTRLAAIDAALTGSSAATVTASYGTLKKVDEVEFYPVQDGDGASTTGIPTLISQGRILIGRLARAFGCSDYLPMGDYFGSRRPTGFTLSIG